MWSYALYQQHQLKVHLIQRATKPTWISKQRLVCRKGISSLCRGVQESSYWVIEAAGWRAQEVLLSKICPNTTPTVAF